MKCVLCTIPKVQLWNCKLLEILHPCCTCSVFICSAHCSIYVNYGTRSFKTIPHWENLESSIHSNDTNHWLMAFFQARHKCWEWISLQFLFISFVHVLAVFQEHLSTVNNHVVRDSFQTSANISVSYIIFNGLFYLFDKTYIYWQL